MPELPEVETILQALKPKLEHEYIHEVIIRQEKLRWPITPELKTELLYQRIIEITRRAKYLLFKFDTGTLVIHLGMSGRLQLLNQMDTNIKHAHVDIFFSNTQILRYIDPRRFGCILWINTDPYHHSLLKHLGPEPFSDQFSASYLYGISQKRKIEIKELLMNSHVVAGVGNIYAAEILFQAQISPSRPASSLSLTDCQKIQQATLNILGKAIEQGGTTIKDFASTQGELGYFAQKLQVYGRGKLPCHVCESPIVAKKMHQRTTFFCQVCQV